MLASAIASVSDFEYRSRGGFNRESSERHPSLLGDGRVAFKVEQSSMQGSIHNILYTTPQISLTLLST